MNPWTRSERCADAGLHPRSETASVESSFERDGDVVDRGCDVDFCYDATSRMGPFVRDCVSFEADLNEVFVGL